MRTLLLALLCTAALAGPTLAQDAKTAKGPEGKTYFETPAGMTLYVFDGDRTPGDSPGAPTCYDQCAQIWPPFLAAPGAKAHGDWSLYKRKDGSMQWAYKKRPLYTFVRDTEPGNIRGEGFNGNTWHLAEK